MPSLRQWVLLSLLVTMVSSCSKEKEELPKPPAPKQTAPKQQSDTTSKKTPLGNDLYRPYKLTGAQSLADLSKELGKEKMFVLLKVNRRDLKHLKEGETIVVPNGDSSAMTYSPFPDSVVSLDSVKKILIVSRRMQAFGA